MGVVSPAFNLRVKPALMHDSLQEWRKTDFDALQTIHLIKWDKQKQSIWRFKVPWSIYTT